MTYTISREIGIDAGHRVPTHGSKCKNLHGHRYVIQAILESDDLHEEGEQQDMTLDFGFLKEEMMHVIDLDCDHGLILWAQDPLVRKFFSPSYPQECVRCISEANKHGGHSVPHYLLDPGTEKLYLISKIPTAEVLAKHWFNRLEDRIFKRSGKLAWLAKVKVWETPNCWASYERGLEPKEMRELIMGAGEGR